MKLASICATALAALTSCTIPADHVSPFGAVCSAGGACGPGYACDAQRGICVPRGGEGEEGEGAAEGEGAEGEGEGEGGPAEGEGAAGEGEGGAGEGEGGAEGEGDLGGDCTSVCECDIGESCFGQRCGRPLPVCSDDGQCGHPQACGTCGDGCTTFPHCDQSTFLCAGVVPALRVEISWQGSAELSVHMSKKDAQGHYCMDAFVDVTNFGPLSQACADAPLDCSGRGCTPESGVLARPHWDSGASTAGDPGLHEVDLNGGQSPSIFAVQRPAQGDYVAGAFFFSDNNSTADIPTAVTLRVLRADGSVQKTVSHPLPQQGAWIDFVHIVVNAQGVVSCIADVANGADSC